jgi:hypothetical protein
MFFFGANQFGSPLFKYRCLVCGNLNLKALIGLRSTCKYRN